MLDRGRDQAAGLRRMMGQAAIHLLPLAVVPLQPSLWIAQVTQGLRELGRQPVVVDASRGHASRAFGLKPRGDLLDLLEGREQFDMVAHRTRDGIHVLRADLGMEAFVGSGAATQQLLAAFGNLSHGFDELVLAMPGAELASIAAPAAHVPVVPIDIGGRGLLGSYSVVKQLAEEFGYRRVACVVSGAADAQQARAGFDRLAEAARQFLGADALWGGWLAPAGDPRARDEAARTAHALLRLTQTADTALPA